MMIKDLQAFDRIPSYPYASSVEKFVKQRY